MNTLKRIGLLTLIFITLLSGTTSSVQAASYNSFSVVPNIPENQMEGKSYFNLLVQPNQTQNISVTIQNTGTLPMVASTKVNNASTGNNGVIVYNGQMERDASLKLAINDLVHVQDSEVPIDPGKSAKVNLQIDVGDHAFEGDILGGIVVTSSSETPETTKPEGTLGIENQVAYVIGLKLSMSEKNTVDSNLSLNKVNAKLIDYRASIVANIVNDQPVIMKGATIVGHVYKEGTTEIISEVNLQEVSIAPNSNFDVIYGIGYKKLQQGSYRIHMVATFQDKKWEWDQIFEIKEEAKSINEKILLPTQNNTALYILGASVIGILLVAIIILIIILRRKRKEN